MESLLKSECWCQEIGKLPHLEAVCCGSTTSKLRMLLFGKNLMKVILQRPLEVPRSIYIVTERRHVIELNNAILALMYEELGGMGDRR